MAKRQKTKAFSLQGFDNRHYKTTEQYVAAVDALYGRATLEIAYAASKGTYNPDKPFSFDDYPRTKAKAESIINDLANKVTAIVQTGSRKQWLFACKKNDEFVASILDTSKVGKTDLKKMQDRNLDAMQTFQGRKLDGMNLSQRVWKYTEQYKAQIELGLDVGLGEGRSAQQLSKDLRQNLQDPDRLFRRVRDKRGNLQLSKAAKAFHPGIGVYRSSAKNAARLTRSEINMAYRESDWLRWQQLDFVIGFEVQRSNHEPQCKCTVCERLVGRYPKYFKFKGWHPQCMCFATPIMEDFFSKSRSDDRVNRLKAALKGTEYKKYVSPETVTDVPDGFKDWVAEKADEQNKWKSTPYFIKDNFIKGRLSNGLVFATLATTATPTFNGYIPPSFNPQQQQVWIDNHKEVERQLNVIQGKEMTFEEANELRGNVNYGKGREYSINCQSCVVANELRRRGFEVTAHGNTGKKGSVPYQLSYQTQLAWIDPKTGKTPQKIKCGGISGVDSYGRIKSKTITELEKELLAATKDSGRYHFDYVWGGKYGHIITVEKLSNGTYRFYDPQNGKVVSWLELKKKISLRYGVNVLRVDELQANTNIVNGVVIGIK